MKLKLEKLHFPSCFRTPLTGSSFYHRLFSTEVKGALPARQQPGTGGLRSAFAPTLRFPSGLSGNQFCCWQGSRGKFRPLRVFPGQSAVLERARPSLSQVWSVRRRGGLVVHDSEAGYRSCGAGANVRLSFPVAALQTRV